MKYSKRFENATQALVSAFLNDTLAKGNCSACAVGNIVSHSLGGTIKLIQTPLYIDFICDKRNFLWAQFFSTSNGTQTIHKPISTDIIDEAVESMEATGYSRTELMKIEYAFETNTNIIFEDYPASSKKKIMEDQYNGLMAVMDVLFDIEGVQEEDRKEYIELFQKCK